MRDPYLEFIVRLGEDDNPLESAITLAVDGFLLSGFVISRRKYMAHHPMMEQLQSAIDKAEADDKAANAEKGEPAKVPEDDGKRNFLHLRDAKYFHPSGTPIPDNGPLFVRVQIKHVSAYSFGSLSAEVKKV